MTKLVETLCDYGGCGDNIDENELTVTVEGPTNRICRVGGGVVEPTGTLHFHAECWESVLEEIGVYG